MRFVQRLLSLPPQHRARAQALMLVVLLLGALLGTGFWVNRFYPVRLWLFFVYAQAWVLSALFALASLAAGVAVLRALGPRVRAGFRPGEYALVAFAVGVFVFASGVFVAGRLQLFGGVFFVLWPFLLLAVGGRTLADALTALKRHPNLWPRWHLSPLQTLALLFGAFAVVLVYSHVLTPENVGYDARWYHLPIAEHYVAAGGIRRFAEGWYLGAYPHLGSWLFTWAFQMPNVSLFDRVTLAAHLEFTLFLATLPGVGLLATRLCHGQRHPMASVAFFLFPGIFLYDSNLILGADHILAFWACPLALALLALQRNPSPRRSLLVAIMAAGAALSKYQAVILLAPAALWALWILIKHRAWKSLLVASVSALLFTSSHWLANWIDYGDPVFPLLHRHLALKPFVPAASVAIDEVFKVPNFAPSGSLGKNLWDSAKAMVTFAFVPHNWESFHGEKPVFGFLFTLLFPALLLMRGTRRAVVLGLGAHLGVFLWFFTNHQDRFLQALVPWMAAVVAVALVGAWQMQTIVKIALAALIAFQIVWSGDIFFFRTHAMIEDAPIKALADHLGAGHSRKYASRFRHWNADLRAVGRKTPRHAKILIHNEHERLGLGRQTLVDGRGYQSAIDYLTLAHAAHAHELIVKQLGATHLLWQTSSDDDDRVDLAREAVFLHLAGASSEEVQAVGEFSLATLNGKKLPSQPTHAGVLSCGEGPPSGFYSVPELAHGQGRGQIGPETLVAEMAGVTVAIVDPECQVSPSISVVLERHFRVMAQRGRFKFYVRSNQGSANADAPIPQK